MTKTIHQTACVMDCPDTCALEVTVQDDKVTAIKGSKDNPITAGFICGKVSRFTRRLYHEDRLLYPLRRTGPKGSGQFERVSWDQAITDITGRFKQIKDEFGGEAILPYHYGGSNGLQSDEYLDHLFFSELGASRMQKTLCAAPSTAARAGIYGSFPGVAFDDFVHARFILIWGGNPKATHIHLIPFLKEAKRRGAFIATVDPVNHFAGNETDLHIGLRPGTDLPAALAMINHWRLHHNLDHDFLNNHATNMEGLLKAAEAWPMDKAADVCGVAADDLIRLADAYAAASPALLRMGWGQERNINGGHASAAILAMPALLGKFGVRGGGYTASNSPSTSCDKTAIIGQLNKQSRLLNQTPLGEHLLHTNNPPIKALFVYNCNPVATCPDQNRVIKGMSRDDLFTVVHEQVMTDSCAYADIVLPATTMLENADVRKSYGNYAAGGVRPVIAPMGETRSNVDMFSALAKAMGFNHPAFDWDEDRHFTELASKTRLAGKPANVDKLLRGGLDFHQFEGGSPIQMKNLMPEYINLTPDVLGDDPYQWISHEQDGYPLALITPASGKMITSTFGEFNYPKLKVTLHPDDAESRGLNDGDAVIAFNDLGEVTGSLKISSRIARGVAMIPKGAWRKSSKNGKTGAALCPSHVEPVGQGACFNDARIEVRKDL